MIAKLRYENFVILVFWYFAIFKNKFLSCKVAPFDQLCWKLEATFLTFAKDHFFFPFLFSKHVIFVASTVRLY